MIITDNGRYKIDTKGYYNSYGIYLSGNADGATVRLQYLDELDNYINISGGTISVNSQYTADVGKGLELYLNVTGGNGSVNLSAIITNFS